MHATPEVAAPADPTDPFATEAATDAPGPVAGARVAFTVFRSADDPMRRAWAHFRDSLGDAGPTRPEAEAAAARVDRPNGPSERVAVATAVAGAAAGAVAGASGCWRLLATNNRELARGFLLYDSYDGASRHVRRLQHDASDLVVSLVTGPSSGTIAWFAAHQGVAVMTSGRWYPSTSTSAESAARAIAALPGARIASEADRSAPSGRFVRRAGARDDSLAW
ncbi:hypothetical protein ACGGZK_02095 [Agromyces sp. MMS24-K17]|uniref:hypothetical protein n=1 Tax=Agromyces sp. MMS24-K17 TaxID=3372850 RepID=UPI003754C0E5